MPAEQRVRVESVIYKGIEFRRYPDSQRRESRVYFTPGGYGRKQGIKRLHQEIWQDHHGPIPEGHHIHHMDGDPLNNRPDNLECVPQSVHQSNHLKDRMAKIDPSVIRSAMDRIRLLSKPWHQTHEGREHHRKLAIHLRTTVKETYTCAHCGKVFEALRLQRNPSNRYCSNACNAAHRRANGADNQTRSCAICGREFVVNRYYKTRTCSRECKGKLISLVRR
jgi:hypothetical protein